MVMIYNHYQIGNGDIVLDAVPNTCFMQVIVDWLLGAYPLWGAAFFLN